MGDRVRYTTNNGDESEGIIVGFVNVYNNSVTAVIRTLYGHYITRPIGAISYIFK